MERKFFEELLQRMDLDLTDFCGQWDKAKWPAAKQRLADVFSTKTRQHWCDLLEGTDACFAPVLSMEEAIKHPHQHTAGFHKLAAPRRTTVPASLVVEPDASAALPPPACCRISTNSGEWCP